MSVAARRVLPSVLRVEIDDIHHIRTELRQTVEQYQYLRLAVTMEALRLIPYVTPRVVENGELDFDSEILFPLKEDWEHLHFRLYEARPSHLHPKILASGRILVRDAISGSPPLTLSLKSEDGGSVCKIAFHTEVLTLAEHDDEEVTYYAPCCTSPLKEVAIAIRRVTKPTCDACQSVVSLFSDYFFPEPLMMHCNNNTMLLLQ